MKVTENYERSFALTHLTGCKFDLFSVAVELVGLVYSVSGAVRNQMSARTAVGKIPSVLPKLAEVQAAFAPDPLSTAGRFCEGEKDHLKKHKYFLPAHPSP